MAFKIFLDTNCIIDFLCKRDFDLEKLEFLFNEMGKHKIEGYISESVITTSIYLLRHHKMDMVSIMRELSSFLKIAKFSSQVLQQPIELFPDKEDAILYYTALENNIDFFITRNTKDFKNQIKKLPAITPSNFIENYYL